MVAAENKSAASKSFKIDKVQEENAFISLTTAFQEHTAK